jgi:hypothetical protein
VLPGNGGGQLIREAEVKVKNKETGEDEWVMRENAATGTKGYLWVEAEYVKKGGSIDMIDMAYFEALADKARKSLEDHGYVLPKFSMDEAA